ncbi:MAG: cold shock domain-containing protein [Myxococcales bacterium]|nr:cold shock domain-containing protein [Myxococcales bacterium]
MNIKGFGFIKPLAGDEVFFHRSSVLGVDWSELQEGQRVSFQLAESPKGPRGEQVQVL